MFSPCPAIIVQFLGCYSLDVHPLFPMKANYKLHTMLFTKPFMVAMLNLDLLVLSMTMETLRIPGNGSRLFRGALAFCQLSLFSSCSIFVFLFHVVALYLLILWPLSFLLHFSSVQTWPCPVLHTNCWLFASAVLDSLCHIFPCESGPGTLARWLMDFRVTLL